MRLIWNANDPVENGIVQNIRDGYIAIVGIRDDGELELSITDTGRAHVEEMLLREPATHD